MKNKLINTRAFAIALAAIITMTSISPALANDEKKVIPVDLKFIGNIENQPVFQLTFSNAGETEFTIIVRDDSDNILYRGNIKGGNSSRKFLLKTEELGDAFVKFEITGKKTDKTVIYEVNKNSRLVEDVVVNKKN